MWPLEGRSTYFRSESIDRVIHVLTFILSLIVVKPSNFLLLSRIDLDLHFKEVRTRKLESLYFNEPSCQKNIKLIKFRCIIITTTNKEHEHFVCVRGIDN